MGLFQPCNLLLQKHYQLSWRMAVTSAYLKAWEERMEPMQVKASCLLCLTHPCHVMAA